MGIVVNGGIIKPGDSIQVQLPEGPHVALEKV
jgi:MOSC domain-containing protein YiiM